MRERRRVTCIGLNRLMHHIDVLQRVDLQLALVRVLHEASVGVIAETV